MEEYVGKLRVMAQRLITAGLIFRARNNRPASRQQAANEFTIHGGPAPAAQNGGGEDSVQEL